MMALSSGDSCQKVVKRLMGHKYMMIAVGIKDSNLASRYLVNLLDGRSVIGTSSAWESAWRTSGSAWSASSCIEFLHDRVCDT